MLSSVLGIRMTLWLGPSIAVPAPASIVEALSAVEVTLSDEGRDGFQLTFTEAEPDVERVYLRVALGCLGQLGCLRCLGCIPRPPRLPSLRIGGLP